jgi:lysyl-tRNA synthetase class 2
MSEKKSPENEVENEPTIDINEQIALRREKLNQLRKQGNPYPNDFKREHLAAKIHAQFDGFSNEELEAKHVEVTIAGRMMTRRIMGKASFFNLQDMSGKIQVYVRQNDLPADQAESYKHWDLGDIVGVKGVVFKTKTGELSVKGHELKLLAKSLKPLPEKYHGLTDQETRYRQRYLDLIMNEKSRNVFKIRTQVIQAIREYLNQKEFVEIETPMMQPIPGGAVARPFITHHNTLDMKLYLRIAPELYLKRMVVGGFERVYEINRSFRNEGMSTRHNPEFTMLEFYQAYADYKDLITLTEDMMRVITQKVLGTNVVTYQGETFDFGKPFTQMTVKESILHYNPTLTMDLLDNKEKLTQIAQQMGIQIKPDYGIGKIQIEIFEKTVESKLKNPTFITEYPTEVSPLARSSNHNPEVTDRFEFFVGGREMANGFSELNDPEDQAARFKKQVEQLEAGDHEAMHFDADYITALEYGLAPTAGEGIGIDRLVMLLTDSPSIRDVILFPHMRPQ